MRARSPKAPSASPEPPRLCEKQTSLPDGEGSREGYPSPEAVEDPLTAGHPHLPSPSRGRNKRAIPRQATSAVAFVGDEPEDDDPLLNFAPYLHEQPRSNSITPERQRAFIAQLAATGIVKQAATHIGKSIEALYKLRQRPGAEGFAAAWDAALDYGIWRLEDCAMERAIAEGLSNPRANSMLAFVLNWRSLRMVPEGHVVPGHWLYDRIRREVIAELGIV